jgi:hypothetical protein
MGAGKRLQARRRAFGHQPARRTTRPPVPARHHHSQSRTPAPRSRSSLARSRDGEARRELASLAPDHPRRALRESDLAEAIEQQCQLLALRPSTPKKATLEDTELAGKLVKHASNYKTAIDTVRIACANAEADLAGELAPFLARPAEAKRVLRNLCRPSGMRSAMRRTRPRALPRLESWKAAASWPFSDEPQPLCLGGCITPSRPKDHWALAEWRHAHCSVAPQCPRYSPLEDVGARIYSPPWRS